MTKLEVLELAGVKKRRRSKSTAICKAAAIFMLVLFVQLSGALTEPVVAYGAIWQDFLLTLLKQKTIMLYGLLWATERVRGCMCRLWRKPPSKL